MAELPPPPADPAVPEWVSRAWRSAHARGAAAAVLAGIVVASCVVLLVVRGDPPRPDVLLPRAEGSAEAPEGSDVSEVFVHAAGAVARPGLYRLRAGTRVAALLDAAGGPAPDADVDQLNLAAKLRDGERVYVPRRGEVVHGGAPGDPAEGRVDLNLATADQLEELPGIGPATAEAIVQHRERSGPFRRVEDLLAVRGIGEAKLDAIRELVRV